MRRAARTDENQTAIIDALRKLGASVQPLHAIGSGCPDALIGYKGQNYIVEFKDGAKSPSRRKLTEDQVRWHKEWQGMVLTVDSVERAVWAICRIALIDGEDYV